MILAAQIITAIFCLFTLPVNRLPEFSIPGVTVETLYPGMAANEIRSMVTIPLEDGLSPVKGLERIRSVSRDNRSLISLDFRWGTDPMAVSVLVREAVDSIYPSLPQGVRKPSVTTGDSVNEAHAIIAVSSHNGNMEFARKLAEYEMRARLRRIDGAGSVILAGGETGEEHLILDMPRLASLGVSPSEFANILALETSDIPAGNARDGNKEIVVVSSGRPDSVYSLSQTILSAGNSALKVEDSGKLHSSAARRESIFVYNGKEAAALEIYRRPGSDPLSLSRDIKKVLEEASSLFSRDAQIELVADSSLSILSGITGLVVSAFLAAAAVVFTLIIFIRRLRYSLLAALSIPVSAAAGICVLSLFGRSLNGMSLGGLAMGIGLVSDISVIILDLLHRAFGKNKSAPRPHEIGNKVFSISGSSAASTITTALVFIPVILLPGPLGNLFGDIAIALVVSVSAGWIYAQFFLPSLYLLLFNSSVKITDETKKILSVFSNGSLEKKYLCFLLTLVRRPVKVFTIAALLSVLGFFTLLMRPMAFINPDNAEEVWVSVAFPPGTLLESVADLSLFFSKMLSGLPSVKTVYGKAGAEEEDVRRRADIDYRKEELILRCVIKKGIKPESALADINSAMAEFSELPFTAYFPKDRAEVLLGLSAESTFVIRGKDRDELKQRIEIADLIFENSSTEVNYRPRGQRPELKLIPNREASAYLSIPAAQIAETLYILNEGVIAAQLEIEGRPLNVRVTGMQELHDDPVKRLEQIPVKTSQGKYTYLSSLGTIERQDAEASLARLDRTDVIYADINHGSKIPSAITEIAQQADDSAFSRYKNSILFYILLVFILLYMTMGAQFESFLLPLILMLCIPFSLAGAGPALLITNSKIDSGAILGLTALFGLVINNSLILFEISGQKIAAGLPPAAAVCRGAYERFHAILITMLTTILALLPLVISPAGNSQRAMACAMLGGLTASTLLSLFAIPPVLVRFFKWKTKRSCRVCNFSVQEQQ